MKFILLSLILLSACSHFQREALVVRVDKSSTPLVKAIKTARHQLLQNKNSLRIAILKLGLKSKKELRGGVIVMSTEMMSFLDNPGYDWELLSLARLHQQLIPELYQLLSLAREKSLPLYVICGTNHSCDLLRQNMVLKNQRKIHFLKKKNYEKLAKVKPLLVLSTSANLFDDLKDKVLWHHWKTNWVLLSKIDQSRHLFPRDWARVVPTIHEF